MAAWPLRTSAWVWSSWVLFLGAACAPSDPERSDHDHPHPHPHEEEVKTVQVTVWGERFEAFIEHRPVVAGSPASFVTHLTDLVTLEPRREGPITVVLRHAADAAIEHLEPAPARPGIYTPQLTFPRPGDWALELRIPTDAGESVVALPNVSVHASEEAAARAEQPAAPEGIAFLKEQQWKVRTKVEPIGPRRLIERLRVAGFVVPRPGSKAAVSTPLAGRLLAPPGASLPSLGARVEAGQTLALVEAPFSEFLVQLLESEAGLVRARLAVELAELAHARAEKLADQQLKSLREREEAEFALRSARATHDAALALRDACQRAGAVFVEPAAASGQPQGLPAVELRAPIAGLITEVKAVLGEHLPSDRAAFSILDAQWVHIEARVPESELGRVGSPAGGTYELPAAPGVFLPLVSDGAGRLVLSGPEVDPHTRTIPFVYEVHNPDGKLRIGMALTVHLETHRAEEALAVPETALVEEEGRPVVFVQVSGETFEKRSVTLGIRDRGHAQVLAGLVEGERVVTKEAYAIRLASVATALPAHGHAH